MKLSLEIPYVKLRFHTQIVSDTRMPASKVAALRGGLGEMLLRQNCICGRNCGTCRFQESCIVMHTFYSYMPKKPPYVTGKESVGYLIECNDSTEEFREGSDFNFSLVLFGESVVFFNLFFQAFLQLGIEGIGKWKARFRLKEVRNTEEKPIVCKGKVDMGLYKIENLADYVLGRKKELQAEGELYTMRFITPLSMKYQQNYMRKFYSEALINGVARRIQMLNYYMGQETEIPDFITYPVITKQMAHHVTVKRYSSTQNTSMILHGIIGQIIFAEMTEECLECLLAGEILHMGKNISFGFGQYILEKII